MNATDQYSEGFAENDGVKIFYRDYGPINGDPILMVHGLGAQLVHWPPHLIHFLQAHNFRPITYDNRDVGLSSRFIGTPSFVLDYIKYFLRLPIKSEYTIEDMADDGLNLLETLNIHQAHILGTSMGGMIAQIISAQYPQKVKSFTLIASTASTPSPMNAPSRPVRELMMERSKNPNASEEEVIERVRERRTEHPRRKRATKIRTVTAKVRNAPESRGNARDGTSKIIALLLPCPLLPVPGGNLSKLDAGSPKSVSGVPQCHF